MDLFVSIKKKSNCLHYFCQNSPTFMVPLARLFGDICDCNGMLNTIVHALKPIPQALQETTQKLFPGSRKASLTTAPQLEVLKSHHPQTSAACSRLLNRSSENKRTCIENLS